MASLLLFVTVTGCTGSGGGGGGGGSSSEPRTVLVLGDSISEGKEVPGVPPWPVLLQQAQPTWAVINSSRGGDRSNVGVSKVGSQLAQFNPTHVVIFYGLNDAIQSRQNEYEGNLRAMVGAIQAFGAQAVIVLPHYMYQGRSIYNGNLDVVLGAARVVASESGSRLADVNRELANSPELFPDGLHPGLDGQRIIMVTIQEQL